MATAPGYPGGGGIDSFLDCISERLGARTPTRLDDPGLIPASVVLALTTSEDRVNVLFTVRTDTVEHHKSEISFPGGRMDEDDADHLAAALRETWEEIGIPSEYLKLLGEMDEFVSITGYRVKPFVMHLMEGAPPYAPQPFEVSEIIEVPIEHLLDPANHSLETPLGRSTPVHFYRWNDKVIWGLTGGILHNFLKIAFDCSG